jgi:uncharacterized membrane protein
LRRHHRSGHSDQSSKLDFIEEAILRPKGDSLVGLRIRLLRAFTALIPIDFGTMAILALPDSHSDLLTPPAAVSRGRVLAIDVVRGLLMCVIIVGHGLILLNDSELNRGLSLFISKVTNLGTPGFTFISGMLLGYFERTQSDFRRIRRKYFIRGLQLLTLAHLLIALGTYPLREETSFREAFLRYWYITDTLAILFILLPTLVPRWSTRARIMMGTISLLSWKAFSLLAPLSSPLLLITQDLFFGVSPRGNHFLRDTYPILPLAGLFVIGTVLGNGFAKSFVGGTLDRFVNSLRRGVTPLILLSGFLVGLWALGKFYSESGFGSALKFFFYPEKLSSLLPFYIGILFLTLAYFIRKIEIKKQFGRVEEALALFGKTSLFTYVAQYFLVQALPSLIGWRNQMNAAEMILYVGGTIMVLFYLARIYNDAFLKRWKPGKKTKMIPNEIEREKAAISHRMAPELLDLKKDLW